MSTSEGPEVGKPTDAQTMMLYLKLLGGDSGVAQLWFDQTVLDQYRQQKGSRIYRTNSAGRLKSPAGWTLDFGIADEDRIIHVSASDLAQRLPQAERKHWVDHLLTLPTSRNFLTMRLGAHSCVDDGDLRDW